jgi:hypothetical protein
MRVIQFILILLVLFMLSCSNELESLRVERDGILVMTVEGTALSWRSREFQLFQGPSVVRNFTEPEAISAVFKRYYLIFEGTTPENNGFELTIAFDVADVNDMRHKYSSEYKADKGGLHQIDLIIKTSVNPPAYVTAGLCAESMEDAFVEIKRQSQEERLIAGSFRGKLCIEVPSGTINITSAEFKDIKY